MCLDKVINDTPASSGTAYKVVSRKNGRLRPPYVYVPLGTEPYAAVGEWQSDSCDTTISFTASYLERYRTGFHLFKTKEAALRARDNLSQRNQADMYAFEIGIIDPKVYAVYEVQYKDAVVEGMQADDTVIVARTMKLVREITDVSQ